MPQGVLRSHQENSDDSEMLFPQSQSYSCRTQRTSLIYLRLITGYAGIVHLPVQEWSSRMKTFLRTKVNSGIRY